MKTKNIVRILLSLVLVFGFSSAWAKTIKWSMQGDSLTLDPHAQNEGQLLKFPDKFTKHLFKEAWI